MIPRAAVPFLPQKARTALNIGTSGPRSHLIFIASYKATAFKGKAVRCKVLIFLTVVSTVIIQQTFLTDFLALAAYKLEIYRRPICVSYF